MRLQAVTQTLQLLILLRLDFGRGDLGPQFDDAGKILDGHSGLRQILQFLDAGRDLHQLAAQNGQTFVVLILRILVQHTQLQFVVIPLLLQLCQLGDLLAAQIYIGAGFVQQVDGLVRQEAVGDVALRQHHALAGNFGRNGHTVEFRIGLGNALHDLAGFLNGRFCHGDRLETALQRGVFLNVFAVFRKGRSTDHLDLASGKGGLQDVGSIHTAFRVTGTHQIVDFIDDEDDIAALLDLADQALHTAFKLATELGTGHKGSQIQQEHFLIPQLVGHFPGGDPLGKTFRNSGLTDTGLTDETGIVLLAAVQNLNHTLGFHITADDFIQLSGLCSTGQVHTVAVQELVFVLFLLGMLSLTLLFFLLGSRTIGQIAACTAHAAKQLVQQREGCGLGIHLVIIVLVGIIHLTEEIAHLIAQHIEIFLRNAHLSDGLIDLGNAQTAGALQAVAFVQGSTVFNFGNKDNCNIFLTFCAEFRLHKSPLLSQGNSFWAQYSIPLTQKEKQIMNIP